MAGRPKGLELVGTARMIDRVHAALTAPCGDVVLLANDPDASGWLRGARALRDIHPGAGGMAGVHAALQGASGRDVLIVAWDMPFVTSTLLFALLDEARTHEAEVCVPESPSPHGIEPFCAFYSALVLDRLDEFLAGGGGAARDFLARCRTRRLSLTDVGEIGDPGTLLMSVNTGEDLTRARVLAEGRQ